MRCFFALALAALSAGCALSHEDSTTELEAESFDGPVMSAAAVKHWDAYVAGATHGVTLQQDCAPRRFSPAAGVPLRGVVVLFHGFTACPQQFLELAPALNAAGFEVLLPLLPGHGRVPSFVGGKRVDDLSGLPTVESRARYAELAGQMTAIAGESNGTRIVGGLSVGGMVATSALEQGPSVWARGLLMAPFFGPPGLSGWASGVGGTLAPWFRSGWGAECVDGTKPGQRAGICDFTLGNLQATSALGGEVLAKTSTIRARVQLVGVEADKAADDKYMAQLLGAVTGPRNGCFYAKGMPHAFVSKHDHPELDHAWLPALYRAVTTFATSGKAFSTQGTSSEYGYGLCAP